MASVIIGGLVSTTLLTLMLLPTLDLVIVRQEETAEAGHTPERSSIP
jgi:Cu/Ag efflux pump CusA